MMVTVIHLHGPDQAIAVCDRIERGLHEAAGRAQRACQEAAQELKHMLNLINADRAARGVSQLDAEITVPGDAPDEGIHELYRHQAAKADALAVPLGADRAVGPIVAPLATVTGTGAYTVIGANEPIPR